LTLKEHKLKEFAKCLGYDNSKVEINVEDLQVEDTYTGPRLDNGIEELNAEWVLKLLDYMKDGKVLHKKYASLIILKARDLFEKEKSV
jgi:serine/threonine-protein phosphatase 5